MVMKPLSSQVHSRFERLCHQRHTHRAAVLAAQIALNDVVMLRGGKPITRVINEILMLNL